MNNEYEQVVRYIRDNLALGFPPDQLQRQLVQSGWDPSIADRAMRQAMQPPQATQQSASATHGVSKKPILFVGLVLLGVAAAIAVFILTSPSGTNDQRANDVDTNTIEQEALEGELFTSEAAGLSFQYPSDWTFEDLSSDNPDSFYWQLEKPGGDEIAKQLEEKYDIQWQPDSLAIGGESPAPGLAESFEDPLVRELATVSVTLKREPGFVVEKDLAEWKQIIDVSNGLAEGLFRAESFENITVSGGDGLKYKVMADIGGVSLTSVEYVVILPGQRLEVSVFPGVTNAIDIVDAIVESVQVN